MSPYEEEPTPAPQPPEVENVFQVGRLLIPVKLSEFEGARIRVVCRRNASPTSQKMEGLIGQDYSVERWSEERQDWVKIPRVKAIRINIEVDKVAEAFLELIP